MSTIPVPLHSLRARKEDIPLLAKYFLDIFKQERGLPYLTISEKSMTNMMEYDWPGNIRELRNAIERAVVMGNGKEILPEDLPILSSRPMDSGMRVGLTMEDAVNNFKKEFIALNLRHAKWNRSEAAKAISIQRTYLSRLISKYNLQKVR